MSTALNDLVTALKKFPGIGLKSARRIAYHLIKQDNDTLEALGTLIANLKKGLHTCGQCGNISEHNPCSICTDPLRDRKTLCIVDDIEALSTFEQSGVYNGLYHILGGRVSPIDGEELSSEAIDFLLGHIEALGADEVIIATSPKVEGDMTYYTLLDVLRKSGAEKVTRIAYGLPVGGAIEFADRMTLNTALEARRQVL
ncbi:MAG: recombination protein RecR [Synergistaceae bacterium]|nr:recombination protein RecR [Synergistaceae bacterium]